MKITSANMEGLLSMCMLMMAVVGKEGEAVSLPHHPQQHPQHNHPHRHHLRHLQDAIDRLELRQRTDHILISNLQKAVTEAQKGGVWGERRSVKEEVEVEEELGRLRESVEGVRGSLNQMVKEELRQDELLEMRQELALLRSEVKRLKASREVENARAAALSHTHQQREAVTAAWVVDNVKRLQDAVMDLQQAFNVTTAMHDKQEVESRLLVVSKDLRALRGSMAGVTSKAEAAAATVTALEEELARTSKDSHLAAGKVASLETEVTDMRDDFNNLLVALPDGILAGARDKHLNADIQVLKSLEGHGHTQTERRLETRMEAVETGVGEVQASSMQLMATLEALEARMQRDVAEVRQEVAKLEFKAAAKQDTDKT